MLSRPSVRLNSIWRARARAISNSLSAARRCAFSRQNSLKFGKLPIFGCQLHSSLHSSLYSLWVCPAHVFIFCFLLVLATAPDEKFSASQFTKTLRINKYLNSWCSCCWRHCCFIRNIWCNHITNGNRIYCCGIGSKYVLTACGRRNVSLSPSLSIPLDIPFNRCCPTIGPRLACAIRWF